MSVSSNIRIQRKKAGLTQIELAEQLGVSIATLRRWEAGETSPTGTRIIELANLLGISPDSIMQEDMQEGNGRASVLFPSHERSGGMLVFEGEGTRIELPPTEQGFELFSKLVENLIKNRDKAKQDLESQNQDSTRKIINQSLYDNINRNQH